MKRQHPFLSSIGFLFTFVLIVALAGILWLRGGLAFSPGKLSAKSYPGKVLQGFTSHAEFESECSRCHQPLQTTQDNLCTTCHENVATQIISQKGAHGHIDRVQQCAVCHTDHHGPDFDTLMSAFAFFVHENTYFQLVWHQVNYDATPIECQACHNFNMGFSTPPMNCALCHAEENLNFMLQHTRDFGDDCLVCHNGVDSMVNFDHQATNFPLDGNHAQLDCANCHELAAREDNDQKEGFLFNTSAQLERISGEVLPPGNPFANTPTQCAECHREPPSHLNVFPLTCDECHTAEGWVPATLNGSTFRHNTDTRFTLALHLLDFAGQPFTCLDCHQTEIGDFGVQSCIACHLKDGKQPTFMEAHRLQFGDDCLACHDGADRMQNFDHARVFPLEGQHALIDCAGCHQDYVFAGTATACVQCHLEPEIHAGFFGVQCQYCHTEDAWTPARLRRHTFPLNHGGLGENECQTCHQERYFEYTCYSCHDHQPEAILESHLKAGIALDELPDCIACHLSGQIEEGL